MDSWWAVEKHLGHKSYQLFPEINGKEERQDWAIWCLHRSLQDILFHGISMVRLSSTGLVSWNRRDYVLWPTHSYCSLDLFFILCCLCLFIYMVFLQGFPSSLPVPFNIDSSRARHQGITLLSCQNCFCLKPAVNIKSHSYTFKWTWDVTFFPRPVAVSCSCPPPSTKSQGLIHSFTSTQGCPTLPGWAFDLANTVSKREVIFRVINVVPSMENINWWWITQCSLLTLNRNILLNLP